MAQPPHPKLPAKNLRDGSHHCRKSWPSADSSSNHHKSFPHLLHLITSKSIASIPLPNSCVYYNAIVQNLSTGKNSIAYPTGRIIALLLEITKTVGTSARLLPTVFPFSYFKFPDLLTEEFCLTAEFFACRGTFFTRS